MSFIRETLLAPWPWYVSGPVIFLIMAGLLFSGKTFGLSSNLRTLCTLAGAGKIKGRGGEFFRFDWKSQSWNLVFVSGAFTAGILLKLLETPAQHIDLGESTVKSLLEFGFIKQGEVATGFGPDTLFGLSSVFSLPGFFLLALGGFLIGFGSRYAGGCTSGHAISGLSNFQLPSLIAVIGFFSGGLLMTWMILPRITPFFLGTTANG